MNHGRDARATKEPMDAIRNNLLTLLIFLPTVGAVLVLLAKSRDAIRWTALGTTILTFALSLLLFAYYDWNKGSGYAYAADGGVVQLVNNNGQGTEWIRAFNVQYKVGIDGLSLPLVILSTFICLLACIASW